MKKLFNEMKIPPEERGCYPLLADDAGVVWVFGEGAAERAAAGSSSRRVVTVDAAKGL